MTIRFFAAAREAAGCSSIEVAAGPIGQRLAELSLGGRFQDVLAVSTLLAEGQRIESDENVADGTVVDVLPPYAGG